MAGEGEGVLNASRGYFKVVFSHGGTEYEVHPPELDHLVTLNPCVKDVVSPASGHDSFVQLLLAANPGAAAIPDEQGMLPLHWAALGGETFTCQLLLDGAPNTATTVDLLGKLPLHMAAGYGHADTCQLLLNAAPDTVRTASVDGMLPVHWAAYRGHTATCELLLDAAPQTAAMPNSEGRTPLQFALDGDDDWYNDPPFLDAARCFVAAGPAADVLEALSAVPEALPLFADFFMTRSPHLTSEEWTAAWSAVPAPCPGLMHALPAVLAHSAEQARHLVQRLPPADVQRLRTAALCLARFQKQSGVFLPAALVWRMLALLGARTCSAFFLV
ncbi:hypothetical protein D9Q98_003280 [Chlorella vulgaris]|uniref:Uncharacterized protein n=1 Tax=Chlorella vulgaris TaxID=3077 RepID=A0A9D4TSA4_CHLVU|nr:hypothetical protein D9Q98_003280 [Chlorella vulgaris]